MRHNANTSDATVSRDSIPRSPLRGALNNFSSLPSLLLKVSGLILQDQTRDLGI